MCVLAPTDSFSSCLQWSGLGRAEDENLIQVSQEVVGTQPRGLLPGVSRTHAGLGTTKPSLSSTQRRTLHPITVSGRRGGGGALRPQLLP